MILQTAFATRLWWSISAAALLIASRGLRAGEVNLSSRSAVVTFLRLQEESVRGAYCEFEVIASPTREQMIPLIRDVCRRNGTDDADSYIASDAFARANSFSARWWRLGAKERFEKTSLDGMTMQQAFDGQILRTLGKVNGKYVGAVETPEGSHWIYENRKHPFALLFLLREVPYWALLEKSNDVQLAKVVRDGRHHTRVQFRHPNIASNVIVLLFASNGQLVERQLIYRLGGDPQPRIYEIHEFGKYDLFDNKKGARIVFPKEAVYHYYVGTDPNGGLVERTTDTFRLSQIRFNIDIPDDKFSLSMPRSAEVWDGLTGLGFLKPGERPDMLFPEEVARRRWIAIILVVAAVVLTAAVVWYRRRRATLVKF